MIVFGLDFCTKSNKRRKLFVFEGGKQIFAPFVGICQYDALIRYSQEFYQNDGRNNHGLSMLSLTKEQIAQFEEGYNIFELVKTEDVRKRFFEELKADEPTKQLIRKEIDSLPQITFKVETFAGKDP